MRARIHCTIRCRTERSRSWNFLVELPTRKELRHPRMIGLSLATIAAHGIPQAPSCRLLPNLVPYGLHGFLSGPHEWNQLPGLACAAFVEVEPKKLKPCLLHVDDARLRWMPRQFESLQNLGDGVQGLLGLSARAADDNHVIRIPRELPQRALLLGPIHIEHVQGDVGHHGADHAPLG